MSDAVRTLAIRLLKTANEARAMSVQDYGAEHNAAGDVIALAERVVHLAVAHKGRPQTLDDVCALRAAAIEALEAGNGTFITVHDRAAAIAILQIAAESGKVTLKCDGYPTHLVMLAYQAQYAALRTRPNLQNLYMPESARALNTTAIAFLRDSSWTP